MTSPNPPPSPTGQTSPIPWRTGTKVHRTIYDASNKLIGVMDTPEDARIVVDAVNLVARSLHDLQPATTP